MNLSKAILAKIFIAACVTAVVTYAVVIVVASGFYMMTPVVAVSATILVAFVTSGAMAGLSAYFFPPRSSVRKIAVGVTVFVSLCVCLISSLNAFSSERAVADAIRQSTSRVRAFMHAHFDDLDVNHDGLIKKAELDSADLVLPPGGEDAATFNYVCAHLSDIGHVVSWNRKDYLVPPDFIRDVAESTKTSSIAIPEIGIDRDDVESYESRTLGLLKDW